MELIDLFNIATAAVTLASVITAATPTPKDDAFMAKYIYPVIEALALNVGKAKE